ncbi:MAG: hypothetical protein EP297_13615 [Gammaproteobacteria bacterium]|nr:MAG: hypothetical protein EP297_13615 [Gammaproteobacteria bacterium]
MSENNPYQAPETELGSVAEIGEPQGVEAGRGTGWIGEGFNAFKQNPGIWIAIIVIWFAISLGLQIIPVIGPLASNLMWPVFMGGIMLGCQALDDGDDLTLGHLFAGFSEKAGPLFSLGAMYLVLMIAVVIVVAIIGAMMGGGLFMMLGGDPNAMQGREGEFLGLIAIFFLVFMALYLPVLMAIWFAPALVMLADKGVFESLKLSFVGCLRNIIPFLVYGIVALILLVIAVIPVGLGLLVMFPVLFASVYAAYKDIYGA